MVAKSSNYSWLFREMCDILQEATTGIPGALPCLEVCVKKKQPTIIWDPLQRFKIKPKKKEKSSFCSTYFYIFLGLHFLGLVLKLLKLISLFSMKQSNCSYSQFSACSGAAWNKRLWSCDLMNFGNAVFWIERAMPQCASPLPPSDRNNMERSAEALNHQGLYPCCTGLV